MKKTLTIVLFLCFHFLFGQKEKVLVTDLTKIKQITNIALSPDGQKAVFTLKSVETNAENPLEFDYRSHLFLTDFQQIKQITRGQEGVSAAVWSPDNKQLAFSRTVNGKSQIFILPLEGGEAFQLTSIKYGATNPNWSKDGKKISFSVGLSITELYKDSLLNPSKSLPAWSLEKPGLANELVLARNKAISPNPNGNLEEIRAYLNKNVEDKKAKVINRLNFQAESTTQPELTFNHIFEIEAKEGAKPKAITSGFGNFNGGAWIDNENILIYAKNDPNVHPDKQLSNEVIIKGSQSKLLLSEKGFGFSDVSVAPNQKMMVYLKSETQGVNIPILYLSDSDGKKSEKINFDRSISSLTWTADSKYVYFTAQSNGGQPIYRLEVQTKKIERLSDFESGILDFDLGDNKIIYAKTLVSNPNELYSADFSMKNEVKLSNFNDWVQTKKLSYPEKLTHTNSKGQKIEYWIMKPSDFDASKKYPLLLNMHGGPTAMWGPGEFSMWHEFQYFCSQGYGIVYANPRGSGGYGQDFLRANVKDWGTGPAEDVLAATTYAAKLPWVDSSKQVITGGSYAGYLTAWIVGHDNRFKAAFAQRGVYDLTTFLGEGNAWRLIPNYFNYPWKDKNENVLKSNSPYTFVENIQTPLLIKHGENDLRTGVIQSEMLYKSMKILGKEVEYVRMPGATHELSRSGNVRQRIDRILRIYEFFERYIQH